MNYSGAGYVYAITNTINGRRYIGSTINLKRRWVTHKCLLNKGRHHSFILQKAWDKYGGDKFKFELLVVCSEKLRTSYENSLMKLSSYNVLRTDVYRKVCGKKISLALKGKSKTEAHRKAISAGKTGLATSQEFKEKARQRQLGVSPSVVTRVRLSNSLKTARREECDSNTAAAMRVYNQFKFGDSVTKLCKNHGINTSTFYSRCVSAGLQSVKDKVVTEVAIAVQKLVAGGETLTGACRKLGLNPKNLSPILARRGINV